jgi:catechol 2,3-dioxygenase-like lactoylglutathione lyase family enzyme
VLHHVILWVPDLARAEESWTWLLGELGYEVSRSVDSVVVLRHPDGPAVALEQSADMVPGMLYSRMRPGVNHMAFTVPAGSSLSDIVAEAAEYGWSQLPTTDRHPLAPGAVDVAYLEDRDGFELELVVLAQ